MKKYRYRVLAVLMLAVCVAGLPNRTYASDVDNVPAAEAQPADAEETEEIQQPEEVQEPDTEVQEPEEVQQPDTESSAAEGISSDEYAQLLAEYKSVSASLSQLEQKLRLMTAVFLFIVAILLIIMFSILLARKNAADEDGDEPEEEPAKKPEKKVMKKPEREPEKKLEEPEPMEPPMFVDVQEEPEAPAAEQAVEKTADSGKQVKKGSIRDSILAYLGIDDEALFAAEDEAQEEPQEAPQEETQQAPREEPEEYIEGAWDGPFALGDGEEPPKRDAVSETAGKKQEGTEDDGIEFIDL
jgi:hypothetical protein